MCNLASNFKTQRLCPCDNKHSFHILTCNRQKLAFWKILWAGIIHHRVLGNLQTYGSAVPPEKKELNLLCSLDTGIRDLSSLFKENFVSVCGLLIQTDFTVSLQKTKDTCILNHCRLRKEINRKCHTSLTPLLLHPITLQYSHICHLKKKKTRHLEFALFLHFNTFSGIAAEVVEVLKLL